MARDFGAIVEGYVDGVLDGSIIASPDVVNACRRYRSDLEREDLTFDPSMPTRILNIVEGTFYNRQGEALDGTPMRGKPFVMEPWQIFIWWNVYGFHWAESGLRRYTQAVIEVARKNVKTMQSSGIAWAHGITHRQSGAKGYIVANSGKQAQESFDNIAYNVRRQKLDETSFCKLYDSFNQHEVHMTMPDGSFDIIALRYNKNAQDSFNCNFAIIDEFATSNMPAETWGRFRDAMKAYRDKLIIGISSAGDSQNTFGWRQIEYAAKVAAGTVRDDSLFAFLCRPELDAKGECDYLDQRLQAMANPNLGVSISPEELMHDAIEALNDPQKRPNFLSRSMNVYTSSKKAWFNMGEFRASDKRYSWTIDELAKMGVSWFGGADLSRTYDLTAAALYGHVDKADCDVVVTHAFFPVTQAQAKADEDSIPLFGWEDDGWLTMCNSDTVQYLDVVRWFEQMRAKGFRIRQIGFDRKFAAEFVQLMEGAKFKMVDQPQYFWRKSTGFRHIEKAAKDGKLYYLHSEAYEYCVGNVHAIEKTDDMVEYHKIDEHSRMDLFDASVFACCKYLDQLGREKKAREWWGSK